MSIRFIFYFFSFVLISIGAHAQSTLNVSGGSKVINSSTYSYSVGEMTLVHTVCTENIIVTQGLLQATPNIIPDNDIDVCPNNGTIDLFISLGSNAVTGGSWSGPPGWTNASTGIFDSDNNDPEGAYTYTVESNCIDKVTTVTISYITTPNPGASTTHTICAGDPSFTLISQMGTGAVQGTWTRNGVSVDPTFTPGTSTPGVYTNTVPAGSCQSVTATLEVIVTPILDAGENATVSFCTTEENVDLRNYLGGNPYDLGVWTDASGNSVSNNFSVSSVSCGDTHLYTHTAGTETCNSTATLTLEAVCEPNAGSDGTINLCSTDGVFSLFDGLIGAYVTQGVWTNTTGGIINNPESMNSGSLGAGDTFTYTVSAAPCASASANVVVSITPAMVILEEDVGVDCTPSNSDYILTFEITGGQEPYEIEAGDLGEITGNIYTSYEITAGDSYSVEISDASGCANIIVSGLSPTCTCPAEASFASGSETICVGDDATLEVNFSGGSDGQYEFVYNDGTDTHTVANASDGETVIVSPTTTTTYTLVSVTDGNCDGNVSGSVTITVEQLADAGDDIILDNCGDGTTLVLAPGVGQPTGGTFSQPSVILLPENTGDYTYTMAGNLCPDDVATYTVNIDEELTATATATCEANQSEYIVVITISGGTLPYAVNGSSIVGNTFTSTTIPIGTDYDFDISDSGSCGDVNVAGGSPNCSCAATASFTSGNETICVGDDATLEVNFSGGIDGQYEFVYNDGTDTHTVANASDGETVIVSPTTTTTYTFVSVGDGDCSTNISGSITITVEQLADAGDDIILDNCGNGTTLVLIPEAGQPTGGIFSQPSVILLPVNTGDYTYTMAGNLCPDDVATYTVNIDEELTATATATCEANQSEYIVVITISGGRLPYAVNGSSIVGNTFTSTTIPIGTDYDFDISDSGSCGDVNVAGGSPNCSCAATASFASGNETICVGDDATLEVNFSGGSDGQYEFVYNDGTDSYTVANASDGETVIVSPTTTTTYTFVSVGDGDCSTNISGSVTITVEQLADAGDDIILDNCGNGTTLVLIPEAGQPTGGTFSQPSVILLPVNAGDYTYTMAGNLCPDDVATYSIDIQPKLKVSNQTAVCSPSQLEYTVSFTIEGGNPPYSINNGPLTYDTSFSETLNYANNPSYSFTVSDSGLCGDVTVSGDAPDCSCFAQGSISGSTTLCLGDETDIVVNLAGNGPFNIVYTSLSSGTPAITTTLNNINNGHFIIASPTSTTTYTLVQISDANCVGNIIGSPVAVTVNTPIHTWNETKICSNTAETYQVQFNYTNGVAPYSFNPPNTTPDIPGVYTSSPIPSGNGYSITANDAGACGGKTISNSGYTCDCISDAGFISSAPLSLCYDETVTLSTNGSETLDGNDVLQYILHDGDNNAIGDIIGTSSNGEFTFDYTSMTPGTVYYIHAVVGNDLGNGNVNLNDICLSLSNGIEVVLSAYPTLSITGGGIVCPGESVDLTITPTGEGPWDFEYAVDGITQNMQTIIGEFILTVPQPGEYTLVSISDNNCPGIVSGTAIVGNRATPTATLSSEPSVCESSGDGAEIALTGDGPWTFVYSIDGVDQAPITTSSSTYTLPVEVDGTYALVSVDGTYCPGTVSGSQSITILPAPTASITGGGSVCEGDFGTFELNLTGSGPWTVHYKVDGIAQNALSGITDGYTFDSSIGGDYVLVSVSDANCSGEILSSQASLTVNALPTAHITTNKDSVCIGESVTLGIDLNGKPPYDVTYVINGDTTIATGLYSNFSKTLSPSNPINFEVIYVSDGSNPSCSSNPYEFAYIDAVVLPNAPILTNDTICSYDGPVSIGVSPAPGLTYTWSPETHLSNANSSRTTFHPTKTGPYAKNFEYVLTATNGFCTASDTMTITVDPGPKVDFEYTPDPVMSEDPTVFFKNKTIGRPDLIYFWEMDALHTSHDYEPSYKFPDGINDTYNITLTAIDPLTGCLDTYSRRLEVTPEMLIYVPSAFTPDGDGINDLWGPVMKNVDKDDYEISVYNRLGELVFTTKDVNQKWNGSFMNDSYFVRAGVYVWIIETKNIISFDKVTKKGIVTVVR